MAFVLGCVELSSFGVVICVGIAMLAVSFTFEFACLCHNDVWMSKRRSRGFRLRRTQPLHLIVQVRSRLVHEVVEVTKFFLVRCTFVDVSFENGVMNVIYSIMVPSHFWQFLWEIIY